MISYRAKLSAWVPIAQADPLAGSGLGTANVTLGALSLAASGRAGNKGLLSLTLGALTLTSSGDALAKGTLTATLGALALTGSADTPAKGTLAATLGALTLAATGDTPAKATLAATLGALTLAGSADALAEGTLPTTTLAPLTLSGSAKALVQGWLSSADMAQWIPLATAVPLAGPYELEPLALDASGTVRNRVFSGTFAATLNALTLAGSADTPAKGTLAATLAPLTATGGGDVIARGALTATLGNVAFAGAGKVLVQGWLASPVMATWVPLATAIPLAGPYELAPLTLAGVIDAISSGTLATTFAPLTLAGAGDVIVRGTLATTFAPLTLAGVGDVVVRGTLAATLAPLTLAGVADALAEGTLAATFGNATLAGAGKALVRGWLSSPVMARWVPLATAVPLAGPYELAPLALVASGTVANRVFGGTLTATLAPLVLAATGAVVNQIFSGTLAATLGNVTFAGAGKALVRGWLSSPVMAQWVPLATAVPLAGPYELKPLALVATGTVRSQPKGTLAATLGALTLAGAAKIPARGSLVATLAPLTFYGFGTGGQIFAGSLAATLAPLTLTGVIRARAKATLSATLGTLTLSSAGNITTRNRTGALHVTLGPLILGARGLGTFPPTSWPREWCPALGPTRSSALAVDVVRFGDGYVHRSTRGLNPVRRSATFEFPFVGLAHLGEMDRFLKSNGATGFLFQAPDESAPVWVCCDEWSATMTERTGRDEIVGNLRATFVRLFNAIPINPEQTAMVQRKVLSGASA